MPLWTYHSTSESTEIIISEENMPTFPVGLWWWARRPYPPFLKISVVSKSLLKEKSNFVLPPLYIVDLKYFYCIITYIFTNIKLGIYSLCLDFSYYYKNKSICFYNNIYIFTNIKLGIHSLCLYFSYYYKNKSNL